MVEADAPFEWRKHVKCLCGLHQLMMVILAAGRRKNKSSAQNGDPQLLCSKLFLKCRSSPLPLKPAYPASTCSYHYSWLADMATC